MYTSDLLVIA